MKVIGVTGGVGSGKSAVLSFLDNEYNAVVLLADDAAKELEKKDEACYRPLIDLLGEDIIGEDGEIDSKVMSSKIFFDNSLLEKVNDIVHPAVKKYILDRIEEERDLGNVDYFFLEAALLIECGYKDVVDEMWYIFVREDIRRDRLKRSRGYTDEKIDSIMRSQLSEKEFRDNCDFVVDNSNTLEESISQIKKRLA